MKLKDNVDIKVFFFVLGEKHNKHRKDHLNHRNELLNSTGFLLHTWKARHCGRNYRSQSAGQADHLTTSASKNREKGPTCWPLSFTILDDMGEGTGAKKKNQKNIKSPYSHSQQTRGPEGQQHGKHWTPSSEAAHLYSDLIGLCKAPNFWHIRCTICNICLNKNLKIIFYFWLVGK